MNKIVTRILIPFLMLFGAHFSGATLTYAQGPDLFGFMTALSTAVNNTPPEVPRSLAEGSWLRSSFSVSQAKELESWVWNLCFEDFGHNQCTEAFKRITEASSGVYAGRLTGLTRLAEFIRTARTARAAAYAVKVLRSAPKEPTFGLDLLFFIMLNPCAGWETGQPLDAETCFRLTGWSTKIQ